MFQSALSLIHGHQSLRVSLRVSMSLYVFVYACALETWANLKTQTPNNPYKKLKKKSGTLQSFFAIWVGFLGAKALL